MTKGSKHSAETLAKMSGAHTGHQTSPEQRAKLSVAGRGNRNGLGHRWSLVERTRMSAQRSGDGHPNWKGGRKTREDGYISIYSPRHPRADSQHRVFEHRLVMEQMLGRPILPTEVVHHINGVRDDNRRENLALCNNQSGHQDVHRGDIFLPI